MLIGKGNFGQDSLKGEVVVVTGFFLKNRQGLQKDYCFLD
jgi:hypothetical protein